MTAVYSVLHMLVDGVCAFAMFGTFLAEKDGYVSILLYNFCAFALQMPFGVILDCFCAGTDFGKRDLPFFATVLGVLLTIAGAFTHPAMLGIGNALFHIGGGIGTIREDAEKNDSGRRLGVFVAPGALGLYLGTLAAQNDVRQSSVCLAGVLMVLLCIWAAYKKEAFSAGLTEKAGENEQSSQLQSGGAWLAVCCFAVVVLRSYIGMAVSFPWKTGILSGAAVLAVVCGKAAGGFLAARYGSLKTAVITLSVSLVCYLSADAAPMGICALFFFNMTMPVTLYLLVCRFPKLPGFAFGFLTFALFLGFLPGYFGWQTEAGGNVIGCVGSAVSLLVLAVGILRSGTARQRRFS